jgi:uncharacterized protein YecT (DUF1311 family)
MSQLSRNFCMGLLLALVTGLVQAQAQPAPKSKFDMSLDCAVIDRDGGTGYEMGQCAGRALEEADAQLNRVYGELRTAMSAEDKKHLLDAQRAWLAWRDKEAATCARASGFGPEGSGYGMVWGRCSTELTLARVKQLAVYLKGIKSM